MVKKSVSQKHKWVRIKTSSVSIVKVVILEQFLQNQDDGLKLIPPHWHFLDLLNALDARVGGESILHIVALRFDMILEGYVNVKVPHAIIYEIFS